MYKTRHWYTKPFSAGNTPWLKTNATAHRVAAVGGVNPCGLLELTT